MPQGLDDILDYFDNLSGIAIDAVVLGGQGLAGEVSNRIHKRGLDSSGNPIAPGYSTKPYFTDIKRLPSTGGIPSENISKNGRWVRLPKGYSDLRRFSRRGQKVDLKLTGHLQTSLRFRIEPDGISLGYIGSGQTDGQGVTAGEKAGFLEALYGKDIFNPSDDEIENFFLDVNFEWTTRTA